MPKKKYSGDTAVYEKKLERVMGRLGVTEYNYDWNRNSCYVEMLYGNRVYRFENSIEKSEKSGQNLTYVSDLFAAVVYTLEGLARATERKILSLDILLAGVPSLPPGKPLEPCFAVLGFTERPRSKTEVESRYRKMAMTMHPDGGGNTDAFIALEQNYKHCLELIEKENSN